MKKLCLVSFYIVVSSCVLYAGSLGNNRNVYSTDDIKKLAGAYVNNNLHLKNPAFVDVAGDGKFDILMFNDGNVEYYRNTGTLEQPFFVLENKHYSKYSTAAFFSVQLPYPVFFADNTGNGKVDAFVVRDEGLDQETNQPQYDVVVAKNAMDLDTGTLITIILVLVIVLLVIAIIR